MSRVPFLPMQTETLAHAHSHLHTPVCHRLPPGLPQTCADITIKPRTPQHCTVIHHTHPPVPNTHTDQRERERAVAGVSSCMLRGRFASHAGSSTKHLDWGVKINFQPQSAHNMLLVLSGFHPKIKKNKTLLHF